MAKFEGWNSLSHKPGSVCPPATPGKLRLYNMRFCPFAHRTVLALAAKGVPVEFVNCTLKAKPEFLLQKNPGGKVPVLELDGKIVYESLICNEWLDDVYPNQGLRLLPKDPTEKAQSKMLAERLSKLVGAVHGWYAKKNDEAAGELQGALDFVESLLSEDFFGGSAPAYPDFAVWPWLERMEAVAIWSEGKLSVSAAKNPKLAAYVARMMARSEVKAAYRDGQTHISFIKSHISGSPDYDIGITAA